MASLHQVTWSFKKRKKKEKNCSTRSLELCPHKKGVVVRVRITTPKKPNSAKRKVARVKLSNKLIVTSKIKGRGHNLQPFSTVLVGGGRYNDVPGVRYMMIKGVRDYGWVERELRAKSRSKYGISRDNFETAKSNILRKDPSRGHLFS